MSRVIELDCVAQADLRPAAPFAFDLTVYKPDHFPSADTHWEPGRRWQTMLWRHEPVPWLEELIRL